MAATATAARAEVEQERAAASKEVAATKNKYEVICRRPELGGFWIQHDDDGNELSTCLGRDGKKFGNGAKISTRPHTLLSSDNAATMTGGTARKLEGPFNSGTRSRATYTPADGKRWCLPARKMAAYYLMLTFDFHNKAGA
jgi:hypothetical protein